MDRVHFQEYNIYIRSLETAVFVIFLMFGIYKFVIDLKEQLRLKKQRMIKEKIAFMLAFDDIHTVVNVNKISDEVDNNKKWKYIAEYDKFIIYGNDGLRRIIDSESKEIITEYTFNETQKIVSE
jgi:hypothetical protein